MKKIIPAAAAAILCLASCSHKDADGVHTLNQYLDGELAAATTFQDSLVAIDGSFIGGFTALQAKMQIEKQGYNVDMSEVMRGIRDVMGVDTANVSYLYGLSMGMEMLQVYRDLAAGENISREGLMRTVFGAMKLDSLSQQQVMQIQPQFQEMFLKVEERARARRDSVLLGSDAAKQNIMLNDAVAADLKSNPDFKAVGTDGLMVHVLTDGNGEKMTNPNEVVNVAFRIYSLEGGKTIFESAARPMMVGRPSNEVVASVLPYMTLGEEAEFFVPYQLAYGVAGQESLKVGPCQSVMIKLSVSAYGDAAK